MRAVCTSLGIMASLLLCGSARAAESEFRRATMPDLNSKMAPNSPTLIVIDAWVGGGLQQGNTQGLGIVALGVTGLFRTSWVTMGVGGELGGVFLYAVHEYLSVLAGATWDLGPEFRVETLAAAGFHFEQPNAGIDLLGVESRIVGGDEFLAIPYVGARVTPTYLLGPPEKKTTFLGALLEVKQDIGSRTPHYMVERCSKRQSDGDYSCRRDEQSYRTGGFHFTVGFRVGTEFDVGG